MKKTSRCTRAFALIGTLLAWIPLAAPVVFALSRLIAGGRFRFDYLMPAELGLVAFIGAGLLLWAAIRARARRGVIGWGLGVMVGALVGSQALAVVTGLASGARAATGWPWALVTALLAFYVLALIAVAVAGILLVGEMARADR